MPSSIPTSLDAKRLVLVVEDEPLQRHMAASVVEEAGYAAVSAAGPEEAIRILESRSDIRVVFTDLDMPNWLEGAGMAATIQERWPAIGLIVTSGWHEGRELELPAGSRFFPKPYSIPDVVEALRGMAEG